MTTSTFVCSTWLLSSWKLEAQKTKGTISLPKGDDARCPFLFFDTSCLQLNSSALRRNLSSAQKQLPRPGDLLEPQHSVIQIHGTGTRKASCILFWSLLLARNTKIDSMLATTIGPTASSVYPIEKPEDQSCFVLNAAELPAIQNAACQAARFPAPQPAFAQKPAKASSCKLPVNHSK